MTIEQRICRRTVLTGATTGLVAALAGCASRSDSADQDDHSDSKINDEKSGPIQSVTVDETQLVIDLERDATTRLNVIDPAGELFAYRDIEAGVTRTKIELGFEYTPGAYEFIALSGDETMGSVTMTLEPNLEFVDLRLARDHPEEMYEGAGRLAKDGGAIVILENTGSAPTAVTALRFRGDVPLPTDSSYDETGDSGIYDIDDDFIGNADAIIIPSGETVRVFSSTLPFSSSRIPNQCETVGEGGQFTIELTAPHSSENSTIDYDIDYLTSDVEGCQLEIEVAT
ncbi:hypothetical protein [Natronosalvus vescus]|uniref:hypothetical protein n=1 Tax=Natronosalvus vescus TaxID=2953881 RepID=UPI0020916AC3|nr:hypothetical protein [Natronosalvus vescus]